jgi:hypothetical protein
VRLRVYVAVIGQQFEAQLTIPNWLLISAAVLVVALGFIG